MLDRNAIVRVADFLRPEDFYLDHHAQVYRAALNLYDRADPIDLLTLASELEKMLVLERIGGQVFLAELESRVPTAANVEYYGHLVEEAATKRARRRTRHSIPRRASSSISPKAASRRTSSRSKTFSKRPGIRSSRSTRISQSSPACPAASTTLMRRPEASRSRI
jgi:replicative DNA helicase